MIWNLAVAPRGRRFSYSPAESWGRPVRIVLARASDGATVAQRWFDRPVTTVVAFGSRRLLLGQGFGDHQLTKWWVPGRHRLGVYSRSRAAVDADLGARQVVVPTGPDRFDRFRVRTIPSGGPSWMLPGRYEREVSWSPDDRRLLTPYAQGPWTYQRLAVLSPAGGRMHTFTGHVAGAESLLRWEGRRTFLAMAYAGEPATDPTTRGALVRCWVGGRCERASAVFDVRRRQPALPFLLAAPRTG